MPLNSQSKTKALVLGLAISGILTGVAGPSLAAGKKTFLPSQEIRLEDYTKKILAASLVSPIKDQNTPTSKPDAVVSLTYEIDDRGLAETLDANGNGTGNTNKGKFVKVGKGGLVAVRLVDEAATRDTGNLDLVFEAPQYLEFGDASSWCGSCEWENDVAVGDMDGDGYNDIVVLNAFQKTVTIFYNDGNGHFTSQDPNQKQEVMVGGECGNTFIQPSWVVGPESDPYCGEHPFKLAIGDFDGDGKQDLAVEYLDNYGHDNGLAVKVILNQGGINGVPRNIKFEPGFNDEQYTTSGWWISNSPAQQHPKLDYSYGSPYYTVNPDNSENGAFQLLVVPPTPGNFRDRLLVRSSQDTASLLAWDSQATQKPGLQETLVFKNVTGPLALAKKPNSQTNDLIVSQGGAALSDLASGNSLGALGSITSDSFASGDFDLDGKPDFARVSGNDLRVGYGDGNQLNAFSTNTPFLGGPVKRPWKRDQVQMVAGSFFNSRDPQDKVYQDLAVLGFGEVYDAVAGETKSTSVLQIWPNANKPCDLAQPSLADIQPVTAFVGDIVTLRGRFGLNSKDQIRGINLAPTSGNPTSIPLDKVTSQKPGNPDEIAFVVPSLNADTYQVSVQNACYESGKVQLNVVTKAGSPAIINSLAPPTQRYGKTVDITGSNFQAGNIQRVNLEGFGPTAGATWDAFQGGGVGKFQVKSTTQLLLQLPTYALSQGKLLEGKYNLTVWQNGKQSDPLELTMTADKPIITQSPATATLGGMLTLVGQGFKSPDVTTIIVIYKADKQATAFSMMAMGKGSFSFSGNDIVLRLPDAGGSLQPGGYSLYVNSLQGNSDPVDLIIN